MNARFARWVYLLPLGVAAVTTSMGPEAKAGMADAELECSAKDKGLKLTGTIPRDSTEFDFTLEDATGASTMWSDDDDVLVVSRLEDGLLTLQTFAPPPLVFWTLKETVKWKKKGRDERATFDAKALVPKGGNADSLQIVTFSCAYVYEI